MIVHFLAAYYPQATHEKLAGRSLPLFESYKFCQAVKTGIVGDPLTFSWKGVTEDIPAGDTVRTRAIFGQFIKKKIFDRGLRDPIIVPVPSKDALYDRRDFRSYQMVREALQGDLNYPIVPALRFTERLVPASLGGPRNVATLFSFMDVVGDLPKGNIVLVDDIMTSGCSIQAAYKRLASLDARVMGAIVCGHTVYRSGTAAFGDHQVQMNLSNFDVGARRLEFSARHWL